MMLCCPCSCHCPACLLRACLLLLLLLPFTTLSGLKPSRRADDDDGDVAGDDDDGTFKLHVRQVNAVLSAASAAVLWQLAWPA